MRLITKAAYWASRMDSATNRDEFLEAWDEWWKQTIGPWHEEARDRPTPERQAEQLLTGQEP